MTAVGDLRENVHKFSNFSGRIEIKSQLEASVGIASSINKRININTRMYIIIPKRKPIFVFNAFGNRINSVAITFSSACTYQLKTVDRQRINFLFFFFFPPQYLPLLFRSYTLSHVFSAPRVSTAFAIIAV